VDKMRLNKIESLRAAQQLIGQGRPSAAIAIYKKIVDDDSSDLTAISTLGDLYVKAGRIPEAVEHFLRIAENYLCSGSANSANYILNKAVKLDPGNATANMNLGELCLLEKKTDQAHAHFIEAAAAFWHKGNIPAAMKMNKRALSVMPDSRQAKAALALLEAEINKPELPAAATQPAPPSAPTPISVDLPPIFISIPDESDVPAAAADKPTSGESALSIMGEPDQIVAVGVSDSGLLELPPELSDSLPQREELPDIDEDTIVEQIARAELLVAYGQVDQAISLLREGLLDKPDHIQIRAKLKDIYLRSEMIDRASEECVNLAGIYAARGELERAGDYVFRARLLSQSIEPIPPLAVVPKNVATKAVEVREPNVDWSQELREMARVM